MIVYLFLGMLLGGVLIYCLDRSERKTDKREDKENKDDIETEKVKQLKKDFSELMSYSIQTAIRKEDE